MAVTSGAVAVSFTALHGVAVWFLGATVALAFFGVPAIGYAKYERAQRRLGRADVRGGHAEEIVVEAERAVALAVDHSSVDPAICIDIGEGKVLLLCGQWAWEPTIYGAATAAEEDPPWWNGLAAPHSFPSRQFRLTRLPATGKVLAIAVDGDYLQPEGPVGIDLARLGPRPSQILDGSLDRIGETLTRLPG